MNVFDDYVAIGGLQRSLANLSEKELRGQIVDRVVAICVKTGQTPREMIDSLIEGLPSGEEWRLIEWAVKGILSDEEWPSSDIDKIKDRFKEEFGIE